MSRRTETVEARVRAGRLPCQQYRRTVGAYGSGQRCDGCDDVTTRQDFVVMVDFREHMSLLFHRECFLAWEEAVKPR